MVLIAALFEMVTDVGAPLFANDAMSSGTVGEELRWCLWSTRRPDRSRCRRPHARCLGPASPARRCTHSRAVPRAATECLRSLPQSGWRHRRSKRWTAAAAPVAPSVKLAVANAFTPTPAAARPGKPGHARRRPAAPATDVSQTLRGESRPINSRMRFGHRWWRPVAITPRQPQVVPQGRCYRIRAGERLSKNFVGRFCLDSRYPNLVWSGTI